MTNLVYAQVEQESGRSMNLFHNTNITGMHLNTTKSDKNLETITNNINYTQPKNLADVSEINGHSMIDLKYKENNNGPSPINKRRESSNYNIEVLDVEIKK